MVVIKKISNIIPIDFGEFQLEYNANKAAIKVDYYERVVRSVAREEKELDGYNEVLGKKKSKKVKEQKAKTEKTKKAKK